MAIKASKASFSINLSASISQAIEGVRAIRVTQQASHGAEFQKAVASGMSYASQAELLNKMIADETNSPFSDKSYIDDLQTNLANVTKMARFETIRNKYKDALDSYVQDKGSLDSYIAVLQDSLSTETNDAMRAELRDKLSQAQQDKAQNTLNAINNRALLAQKDQSHALIDKSIKEVSDKKAKAALNGNDEEVSKWDETLLALNSSKSKLQIEDGMNDLTLKINKNNPKANEKLGYIQDQISKADGSSPVTYNGVTYPSMKDFWTGKRDEYVANSYFDEVQKEMDADTSKIAATNNYGQIPVARIQAVAGFLDGLKTREEFAPYIEKIDQMKVANVADMTTKLSSSLYDEFNGKIDAASKDGTLSVDMYNSELTQVENTVTSMENTFGVKLTRQATAKEAAAGGGIVADINKGMDNLPSESASLPANAAEITRAQDVYANADKLAGTGKYVGKTADQIRQEAHDYATSIRKGNINLATMVPDNTSSPNTPVDTQAEIARAQDVYLNADKLAGTGKYAGQTAEQIRTNAHNYANSLRSGINAAPVNPPAATPQPASTPATTLPTPEASPSAPTIKPPSITPQKTPTATSITPNNPAPAASTPVVYNGRSYKDQAAADKAKARDAAMGK